VRGLKLEQLFLAFFGLMRTGTGSMHSNLLPGSNDTHWAHERRSTPQRRHLLSAATSLDTT